MLPPDEDTCEEFLYDYRGIDLSYLFGDCRGWNSSLMETVSVFFSHLLLANRCLYYRWPEDEGEETVSDFQIHKIAVEGRRLFPWVNTFNSPHLVGQG